MKYAYCSDCHKVIKYEENETPECPRCHKEPKYNNIIVKHLKDLEGED